ncbi:MAG TPA: electron transfer flavoprotein subunit beta/FixA family protein [Geobacterales bacterium]|nr:electron transfer flavoprotein subunit beta/FixA family protein [Geobacterales bacterium]
MPLNIAVLVKAALNLNMLKVDPNGSVNVEETPLAISEYDKNAIEEGIRLKEKHGGKVIALSILTWGPLQRRNQEIERIAREVLSMGVDEFHLILDEAVLNSTTKETAYIAAHLLKKLGNFDLYITGEYSQDTSSSQFASRLAKLLGVNLVTFVNKVELSNNEIIVQRSTENEIEIIRASLPCVISVTGEINQARIPTLRNILQAKNKPLIKYDLNQLGLKIEKAQMSQEYFVLPIKRKKIFIEGKNYEEIAEKLINHLLEEGVIKI